MIFVPVFFGNIGISTNFGGITAETLAFGLAFIGAGIVGKLVGCGTTALCCHYTPSDSFKIGVGMMTRGEVALIVAQKGLSAGLLSSAYFTSVILLILVSSIATPLLLGAIYTRWPDLDVPAEPAPAPAPAKPTA